MEGIGCVILSFEEAGDLSGVVPWKSVDPRALQLQLEERLRPGADSVAAIEGFVYLSTCNRVEIIYSLSDEHQHGNLAVELVDLMPELRAGLRPAFLHGNAALRHLLRLAAGLESLILGETEIRAQLKEALESAVVLDKRLRLMFQYVFRESRQIRASLPLNHLPLSVASLATGKLVSRLGLDRRRRASASGEAPARIAVIGSGPMSRQSARYLAKTGAEIIMINRSIARIAATAESLGAATVSFEDFLKHPEVAGPVDGLVTATSREDAFVTADLVRRLKRHRDVESQSQTSKERKFVVVDMALPRDVHPDCDDIGGVDVVHMDSMRRELDENRKRRELAAAQAEEYIQDAVFRLDAALITGLSAPVMTRLQREVRNKSRRHLDDLLAERLAHLSARDRRVLYDWAIRANRDLNRLHRRGLEDILRHYYGGREEVAGT